MIKFGPAGNCETFYEAGYKRSVQAPAWLKSIGLTAYEYSFGKGIILSDETALAIGEQAKLNGIEISVHAPYFINFASINDEQIEKSYNYVLNSLHKLRLLGGRRLVVHVASNGKLERAQAVELAKEKLIILNQKLIENGFDDMLICLETLGKPAQIGDYQEIAEFCKLSPLYYPALDFGHINALSGGGLKTMADYEKVISYMLKNVGEEKTKNMHVHFSKIEYGAKGEIKHLTLEDTIYGPEFLPLAKVIKKYGLTPFIICESKGVMAHDALILKDIYEKA